MLGALFACRLHRIGAGSMLAEDERHCFCAELPCDFDVLTPFRGVGPKCANLTTRLALRARLQSLEGAFEIRPGCLLIGRNVLECKLPVRDGVLFVAHGGVSSGEPDTGEELVLRMKTAIRGKDDHRSVDSARRERPETVLMHGP